MIARRRCFARTVFNCPLCSVLLAVQECYTNWKNQQASAVHQRHRTEVPDRLEVLACRAWGSEQCIGASASH